MLKKKKIELNLISNIMYVILYSMNGKLVWTNMERRKCNKLSIKILLIYYLDSLVKVNAKIKIKI